MSQPIYPEAYPLLMFELCEDALSAPNQYIIVDCSKLTPPIPGAKQGQWNAYAWRNRFYGLRTMLINTHLSAKAGQGHCPDPDLAQTIRQLSFAVKKDNPNELHIGVCDMKAPANKADYIRTPTSTQETTP